MSSQQWQAAVLGTAFFTTAALAAVDTPASIAATYADAARRDVPGFAGFSSQRGEQFFRTTHGNDWSCASCHTTNPAVGGKHAKTGKAIAPLSPIANPERFTSLATADKWFRRNCNDVVGRECTALEKGDVLAYLTQLKP
ncbi:MAG: DUF1924 domain-containing protein [Casimicrobiaceae bacterium]